MKMLLTLIVLSLSFASFADGCGSSNGDTCGGGVRGLYESQTPVVADGCGSNGDTCGGGVRG